MAARKDWKLMATFTVLVVCCTVGTIDLMDNLQADATQRAQHECQSDNTQCHPNASCYGNNTSYVCMCVPGWDGDGFVGDGHSGCQRRQISKAQFAAYIIAFILAGLVILWFLVDAIWGCIRLKARIRNNALVALAQQAHQGVAPGPVEAV